MPVAADVDHLDPLVAVSIASGATPMRLLQDQATAMLLEAAARQGTLGADLDKLLPADPGLPPTSYLLAGWVSAAGSPGSLLALRTMGTHDWRHAPSIVFPGLVLALYVADATRFAAAFDNGPAATAIDTVASVAEPRSTAQAGFVDAADTQLIGTHLVHLLGVANVSTTGICSRVQGFIDSTIGAVFDALGHLQAPPAPDTGNGFLGFVGAGIQAAFDLSTGLVNGLIDVGRFLVVNGIKLATQPIRDQIAKVAGVLAVISSIVSLLRPWTIRMDASPRATRKAIGDEPGRPGTLGATVDLGGMDEWPVDIADCALQAGVTLPPLEPVGAPVSWTVDQSPGDLIIETAGRATVLDTVGHAEAAYRTTEESADLANGDAVTGVVTARATIRRKEISDLQTKIEQLLLAQIPGLVRAILAPILKGPIETVLQAVPALLDSHGDVAVGVGYHVMSPTTTTTPPTTPPGPTANSTATTIPSVDPCSLITEQEAATALGFDPGPGREDPFGNPADCAFALSNNSPGIVIVDVHSGPPIGGKGGFDRVLAQARVSGQRSVSVLDGIGAGAFRTTSPTGGPENGPIATVVFYKGPTTVSVSLAFDGKDRPIPSDQVVPLARAASGRL